MATASKPPSNEISQLYEILARANQIASNTELDDLARPQRISLDPNHHGS